MKIFSFRIFFVAVLFLLYGCIMPASNLTVSPSTNISSIKNVAVWKFRDGGRVINSGDVATRAIESAFMKKGFKLIAYSKIRDVVSVEVGFREGMALDAGMLTPAVLQKIKNESGVDAIILGSVSDAWCDPMWTPSCWIECAFQMIDTNSGEIIITANISDDGWSLQSAAQQMADTAIEKIK